MSDKFKIIINVFILISTCLVSTAQQVTSLDSMENIMFFDMSIEDIMNMKVTTASKKEEKLTDAPAIISVITQNDIANYGANNLFDVIDRLTGTYTLGSALLPDNMVSFRGDATVHYNNHILYLINGRPLRDNFGGGIRMALNLLYPLDRITKIEQVRGPGSVLYGTGAYTGVINIITKDADKQNLNVIIQSGSFGRVQGNISGGCHFGKVEIAGSINLLKENGWDFKATDGGAFGPKETRTIKMLQEGYSADLSIKYKGFSLSSYYGNSKQRAMYFPLAWSYFGKINSNGDTLPSKPKDYNLLHKYLFIDFGYQKDLTPWWKITINETVNSQKVIEAAEGATDNIAVVRSLDMLSEITNFIKIRKNASLTIGGLVNLISGNQTFPVSARQTPTVQNPYEAVGFGSYYIYNDKYGKNPNPPYIVPKYNEEQYAGYTQIDYKPKSYIKLTVGGQVNKVKNVKLDFVPRLGAIINLNKNFGTKILYASAFRVGASTERLIKVGFVFGNEQLKPEKINTFETQFFYNSTSNLINASITYFYNYQSSLIRRSGQAAIANKIPAGEYYINSGSSNTQGLEIETTVNINDRLSIIGSGTAFSSNLQFSKPGTDTTYSVNNYWALPMTMIKLGVHYSTSFGLSVGLFNSYFSGSKRKNETGTKTLEETNPPINSVNLLSANLRLSVGKLLKYDPLRLLSIGLYGENLLNHKVNAPDPQFGVNTIPSRSGIGIYCNISYSVRL